MRKEPPSGRRSRPPSYAASVRRNRVDAFRYGDGDIVECAAQIASEKRDAEVELCAAVLDDHHRLLRVASAAGIRKWHFCHEDTAVIYSAAIELQNLPLLNVLKLIRATFAGTSHLDPTQIPANIRVSSRWSEASLAHLSTNFTLSTPDYVRLCARRLIDLWQRLEQLRTCWAGCIAAIDGEDLEMATVALGRAA
jgi:hypothetical protein